MLQRRRYLALQHKRSLLLQHNRSLVLQHKRSLVLQDLSSAAAAGFEVRGGNPPRRSSADMVFPRGVPPLAAAAPRKMEARGGTPPRRSSSSWEGGYPPSRAPREMLVLPGLFCSAHRLLTALLPLARQTKLVAVEWRGHGKSVASQASLKDLAHDVMAVVRSRLKGSTLFFPNSLIFNVF